MADPGDVAHLLRRTEFVARPERLAELSALTLAQAVDDVLDVSQNGPPTTPEYLLADNSDKRTQYAFAVHWWYDRMATVPRPFQEKMALFWHGHFVSALQDGVRYVHYMMSQIQLYRTLALGNFVDLTQRMSVEPAMLLYLSNASNIKRAPNENFARELMELFTLGVGNCIEADVRAAARAWTGHNYDYPTGTYVFRPDQHDIGDKTFFGTTKNWDGPDIVDEILVANEEKRVVAARFIAKKLWEFFAHPAPAASIVNELADVFIAHNMQLFPLLRALLNRPEFYSTAAKQGLVRSPIEYAVALLEATKIPAADLNLVSRGEAMNQILLNPPNVAGWKSNGYWLNTSAVSGRAGLAKAVSSRLRANGGFDHLHDMSATDAVDQIAAYFRVTLTPVTRDALIAAHQAERDTTPGSEQAAPTNLLTMTIVSPEFNQA